MNRSGLTKPQQLCLGYGLVHVLVHVSARWFEVLPGIVTSIWYPPCGLALALLVLLRLYVSWLPRAPAPLNFQKTLVARAPLSRLTLLVIALVSRAASSWKMKTGLGLPWPSSVSLKPSATATAER